MPRHHLHHVAYALIAAFLMDPIVVPEFSGNRPEQSEVGLTQHAKVRQRLPWIALRIIKGLRPQVLIVSLDGNRIIRQNLTQTPGDRQLCIGKVGNNLRD